MREQLINRLRALTVAQGCASLGHARRSDELHQGLCEL